MITPELVATVLKEALAQPGQREHAVTQEVGLAIAKCPEAGMFCLQLSLRAVEQFTLLPDDVLEPDGFQTLAAQQLHHFITPAMHLVIAGHRLAEAKHAADGTFYRNKSV